MTPTTEIPTAPDLGRQLRHLYAERALAALHGLLEQSHYMAELDEEIQVCHEAYVRAAVTDIAVLRAELSGRLRG